MSIYLRSFSSIATKTNCWEHFLTLLLSAQHQSGLRYRLPVQQDAGGRFPELSLRPDSGGLGLRAKYEAQRQEGIISYFYRGEPSVMVLAFLFRSYLK